MTSVPIVGHVLPLFDLALAAAAAGDEVRFAVSAEMASLVAPLTAFEAGPGIATLLDETIKRTGHLPHLGERGLLSPAAFFGDVRVDLTYDELLRIARDFAPDAVIADEFDTVGPMVAAAMGIPWIQHAIGLPVVPEMQALIDERVKLSYADRDLAPTPRLAIVDPWPPALRLPGWSPAADQLPLRARPWSGAAPAEPLSLFGGREDRSRVLIALGTTLLDREAFDTLVDVVSPLDGVDVLAAVAPGVDHPMTDRRENVRLVGFVPMASLLTVGLSVMVAAGGAGTVLAALGQGIPMVIWPEGAEKPLNAERVANAGAGVVIQEPARAGEAVRRVLDDPSYRAAAARLATEIAQAPTAAEVWQTVRSKVVTWRRP